MTIIPIAHIESEFPQKFGIPRQSLLVKNLVSRIIFEPEYRNFDCIRGLEGSSHIWLIWEFSENSGTTWQPLVRPPRLGGNKKLGVFATRSPNRPNSLAISAVKVLKIDKDFNFGPVIEISGADLLDGTPIYDIKPYVPYSDCIEEATTELFSKPETLDDVIFECKIPDGTSQRKILALRELILQDPRPAYKKDGNQKKYAFEFSDLHIEFVVENNIAKIRKIKLITNYELQT